jgi:hypothetical protein
VSAGFDRAVWLAEQLNAQTPLTAVVDVAAALGNLPCVLIPPPTRDFRSKSAEWSLVVLGDGPANAASWQTIDAQLEQLDAQLPIETARPGSYQLPGGDPAGVACYVVTFVDTWQGWSDPPSGGGYGEGGYGA